MRESDAETTTSVSPFVRSRLIKANMTLSLPVGAIILLFLGGREDKEEGGGGI